MALERDDLLDFGRSLASDIAEAIKGKGTSSGSGSQDVLREFRNFGSLLGKINSKVKDFSDSVEKTETEFTYLQKMANAGGVKQSQLSTTLTSRIQDLKKFETALKSLTHAAEELGDISAMEELAKLEQAGVTLGAIEKQKQQLQQASLNFLKGYVPNLIKEHVTFQNSVSKFSTTLVSAASFSIKQAGSLLSSGDMFGPAQAAVDVAADLVGKGSKSVGSGIASVGTAMMAVPGPTMAVGAALTGLGAAIGFVGEGVSKLAKEGFALMLEQTKLLISDFNSLSSAGALFSNGLTGMIDAAGQSGLTVGDFNKAVMNTRESFLLFGGTLTGGIEKVSAVSGRFSEGIRKELLNLGYGLQEQVEHTAEYMNMLARSGNLAGKSQQDLADESAQYMKNLRVITSITGEDAKKAQARARAASEQAAVQAKLARMGPEAQAKFSQMIKQFPGMEKVISQLFVTGQVTGENAVAMAQMPSMMAVLRENISNISDSSVDQVRAQSMMVDGLRDRGQALRDEANAAGEVIGTTALMSDRLGEVSNILAAQSRLGLQATNIGEGAAGAAERAAKTQDDTTKNLANAAIEANNLKVELQKLVVNALPGFTGLTSKILESYNDVFSAIRKALGLGSGQTAAPTIQPVNPAAQSAAANAAAERLAAAREGGVTGSALAAIEQESNLESSRANAALLLRGSGIRRRSTLAQPLEEKALGGVVNRPVIAGEAGPEAIIPLPDGKNVPVQFDRSMTASVGTLPEVRDLIREQNSILLAQMSVFNSMVEKLERSINIQRDILNTSL
jgi:hypothetical protein